MNKGLCFTAQPNCAEALLALRIDLVSLGNRSLWMRVGVPLGYELTGARVTAVGDGF
jgi:hypothetical protein